jgi:hypothetical protein
MANGCAGFALVSLMLCVFLYLQLPTGSMLSTAYVTRIMCLMLCVPLLCFLAALAAACTLSGTALLH